MGKFFDAVIRIIPPQLLLVVTGVALLALGVVALGYQMTLNHTRHELVEANNTLDITRTNLSVCVGNQATLRRTIEEQNAAIDALKAAKEAADVAAKQRVQAILAKPRKQVAGAGPEAVNTWLKESFVQ